VSDQAWAGHPENLEWAQKPVLPPIKRLDATDRREVGNEWIATP